MKLTIRIADPETYHSSYVLYSPPEASGEELASLLRLDLECQLRVPSQTGAPEIWILNPNPTKKAPITNV